MRLLVINRRNRTECGLVSSARRRPRLSKSDLSRAFVTSHSLTTDFRAKSHANENRSRNKLCSSARTFAVGVTAAMPLLTLDIAMVMISGFLRFRLMWNRRNQGETFTMTTLLLATTVSWHTISRRLMHTLVYVLQSQAIFFCFPYGN